MPRDNSTGDDRCMMHLGGIVGMECIRYASVLRRVLSPGPVAVQPDCGKLPPYQKFHLSVRLKKASEYRT